MRPSCLRWAAMARAPTKKLLLMARGSSSDQSRSVATRSKESWLLLRSTEIGRHDVVVVLKNARQETHERLKRTLGYGPGFGAYPSRALQGPRLGICAAVSAGSTGHRGQPQDPVSPDRNPCASYRARPSFPSCIALQP